MTDFDDLQKVPRQTDWDYVAWIDSLPCVVCGRHGVDPHHLSSRGSGGSDYSCIPLKRKYHNEIEQIGVKAFNKKHHCDVWHDAWRLVVKYFTEELDG